MSHFIYIKYLYYLILTTFLFSIGLIGILFNKKNIIRIFLCIEMMNLSSIFNFIIFSNYLFNQSGKIIALYILAITGIEIAIGLSILSIFNKINKINNLEYSHNK